MIRRRLLIIACLGFLLILLYVAGHYPDTVEQYYSQGLYRPISSILHRLFNLIPFSIGDVGYLVLIGCIIYALFQLVRFAVQKRFRLMGYFALKVVLVSQSVVAVFYLLWGLNYFRPAISQRLNLQDTTYTLTDLKAVTAMLIDSVNARRAAVRSVDTMVSNSTIYQSAVKAINELGEANPAFKSCKPCIKPSLFTSLLNYMGTSGYYNPFTGEGQMNYQMPVVDRPVTCCHEMGHQMGYGREDEANFIGFVAGIHSDNRLLSYSAYYLAAEEFLRQIHHRDSIVYHQLKSRLSAGVRQDMKADSIYWTSYESRVGLISNLFYDRFLKVNNQPAGLHTYNRMIRLTMAYYRPRWVSKAAEKQHTSY